MGGSVARGSADRQWLKAATARGKAFVIKHWLIICFFFATLIALTAPAPGRAVSSVVILGDIHLIQTINIIIVFVISGLVLKTDDIKRAARHWLGALYGLLSILLITPCLGFALRELPLTPPEFAVGLTIFAAVPTTLGVGEALVRASGGNAALALLLLVGTNALGVVTMPPLVKLLLSNIDGFLSASVDAVDLLVKLVCTVLVPAILGKVARELFAPVRTFVARWKVPIGMFSNLQLALIIWQTLSGAQDVLVHQQFLDIFIVIVSAGIMHLVYLAFNFAAVLLIFRMPLPEAIAVGVMSSQKSAPVAVTVISYLTSNVAQQGLLAVPCIAGQLFQIFLGAGIAPFLARRVARRAANSSPAAGDLALVAAKEGSSQRARQGDAGQPECCSKAGGEDKLESGSGSGSSGTGDPQLPEHGSGSTGDLQLPERGSADAGSGAAACDAAPVGGPQGQATARQQGARRVAAPTNTGAKEAPVAPGKRRQREDLLPRRQRLWQVLLPSPSCQAILTVVPVHSPVAPL